jgi:isoquinoline 1-oxidoreductase subunit beta
MPEVGTAPEVTRRRVLTGVSGLVFCLVADGCGVRLVSESQAKDAAESLVTQWVRITPDNSITILSVGAEMGQGSMGGLALILAEELDADWDRVKIEFAPADKEIYGYKFASNACLLQSRITELAKCPPERMMLIVGSRATPFYFQTLRLAGAQVRKVLLQAAADRWGVDAASLKTEPSVVVHPPSSRRLSYGDIAAFASVSGDLPSVDASELKSREQFRLIGKAIPRKDIPAKVDGSALYAINVRLPDMVYATTLHSPVHGAEPMSWNEAEIKNQPGILAAVRVPNGVAVVADRFERALDAKTKLKVTWTAAKAQAFNSDRALESDYSKICDDAGARELVFASGNVDSAFAGAIRSTKLEFRSDYAYHAQMEPLNAVARLNSAGDHIEVWEGTQAPDQSRSAIAAALGFSESQVTHHQCLMGGGFGRRTLGEYPAEAALIARATRRPVKLIWTREEDLAQGRFRPQAYQRLEAATDTSGKVTGWRHAIVGDGGFLLHTGQRIPYYTVPHQRLERSLVSHGVNVYFWRAVGHLFNVFAIESVVDQLASDQGMDPIEFRVRQMGLSDKGKKAFERVAKMSDWGSKRPSGRAVGVSIAERSGSLGAGVVEISVNMETGKIRVHKIWSAIDAESLFSLKLQSGIWRAASCMGYLDHFSSV